MAADSLAMSARSSAEVLHARTDLISSLQKPGVAKRERWDGKTGDEGDLLTKERGEALNNKVSGSMEIRVSGLCVRDQDLGFRVWGPGFRG